MMSLFGAARSGVLFVSLSLVGLACSDKSSDADEPTNAGGSGGTAGPGGTRGTGGTGGNGGPGGTGGTGGSGGSGGGTLAQGGSAGAPMGAGGDPEAGGSAGMTGDAGASGAGGAGGAPQVDCGDACDPCDEAWEIAACSEGPLAQCVCEPEDTTRENAHNALLSCSLAEPCPETVLTGVPSPSWQGAQCLREALVNHTPGRYRFTDDLSDLGTNTTRYQLLVSDDGSVLVSGANTAGLLVGNLRRQYLPVQRCTLKSTEALEECLPESDGPYSSPCSAPRDWLENCEDVAAVCPEE